MLEEIQKALEILIDDDQIVELRAFGRDRKEIVSGFFKYRDVLARRAHDLDMSGKYKGIHITLNPVKPELYDISPENIIRSTRATTDADILKRTWFPIDVDPVRKSGVSATDNEHAIAMEVAQRVAEFLQEMGLPEPVLADSGNGAHLLWKIDLPNNEESRKLIDKCLRVIADLFDSDQVKIDRTVSNASRIWKLYGTTSRKGDNSQDRPWRMSKIIKAPAEIRIVTREQLLSIASLLNDTPQQTDVLSHGSAWDMDIEKWIEDHGYSIHRIKDGILGKIYVLDVCPMNPEHDDKSAFIIKCNNGRILFKCHHDHCKEYTWSDVLKKHGETVGGVVVGNNQVLTIYDVTKPDRKDPSVLRFSPTKAARAILSIYSIITDDEGEMWVYDNGIYVNHVNDLIDKTLSRVAGDLYTLNMSRETIRKVQIETRRTDIRWNPNPNLFGVANGVIDLETGEFLEYSPDMYITIRSPVIYDPKADCKEIKKFFRDIFATDDDILTIIDCFVAMSRAVASGYFLTLIGIGGNGKKVLETLMMAYVGNDNYTTVRVSKLDNDRFARMALRNKRLLINSEVSGEKAESDWIKLIATGDVTDSDVKYKNRIKFSPFCFQVFDTNIGQKFHDTSRGFTRRILKLDCPYIFTPNPDPNDPTQKKEDPDIYKKILAPEELSGLLNIVIKRAPHVIKTGHIYHRKSGDQMSEEYYMQSNSVAVFVDRFTSYDPHASFILTTEIYDAYKTFCKCINATAKRENILSRYLAKVYHKSSREGIASGKYGKGYNGILINYVELDKFISMLNDHSSTSDASKIVAELFNEKL